MQRPYDTNIPSFPVKVNLPLRKMQGGKEERELPRGRICSLRFCVPRATGSQLSISVPRLVGSPCFSFSKEEQLRRDTPRVLDLALESA